MTAHDTEVELVGPDDGGWYHTKVYDWIALNPELTHAEFRLYVILRSLCIEKQAPVKRLTIEHIRRLLPGVNGKEASRTVVEDALRKLKTLGLVQQLDSGRSGVAVRYRINDMPAHPESYTGWRNTFSKADATRPEGDTRNSGQVSGGTRISGERTRISGERTRNSGERTPNDRGKPAPKEPLNKEQTEQQPFFVDADGADGGGKSKRDLNEGREDVERLCKHLAERIIGNGCKPPRITKQWRDAARLLLDADGRTEEQVHKAIDWCQDDEFWRSNILSMPKLRKQYETLRLRAAAEQRPPHLRAVPSRRPTQDEKVAALLAKAGTDINQLGGGSSPEIEAARQQMLISGGGAR